VRSMPEKPEETADGELRLESLDAPGDALVVGASGGLGRALVEELSRVEGIGRVFAWSRSEAGDWPEGVVPSAGVDLERPGTLDEAARDLAGAEADLRRVFNAAGILHDGSMGLGPERRLSDLDAAHLARIFAVNAVGPLLVFERALPFVPRGDRAMLVSISARIGSIGDNRMGGWYGYRASKAALNQLQRSLAVELARTHRKAVVLALHPGTVDTALSEPFQGSVDEEKLFRPDHVARRLLELSDSATREDSGGFFAWDGSAIPW